MHVGLRSIMQLCHSLVFLQIFSVVFFRKHQCCQQIIFLHRVISGDNPVNTGVSGVEISGDMVEFLSCPGQEQFNVVCSDQEVAANTIECGKFDVLEIPVFFDIKGIQQHALTAHVISNPHLWQTMKIFLHESVYEQGCIFHMYIGIIVHSLTWLYI